jgi:hypothetical protein
MYGVIDGEKLEAMRQDRVRSKTAWKVANVFGVHPSEMGHPVVHD